MSTKTKKLTPKEIAQKRLANSKLMEKDKSERFPYVHKEHNNMNIQLPPIKKSCYKIHDRVTEDFGPKNPFDIPNHMRVFTKSTFKRKTKPEPFIMTEPRTICDVDFSFYNIIDGRPPRIPDDIKVYMKNIRDITMFKANASYIKSEIILIDTSYVFELTEWKAINKLFYKCKDNFVQFAKQSYKTARRFQDIAANKAAELDRVTDELEALSFTYVASRNQLSAINITYETLAKYRQFLFNLSPLTWRQEYDTDYINRNAKKKEEKVRFSESAHSLSRYEGITDAKPVLFFTKPGQLDLVFENLSRQCLTYMGIGGLSASLVNSLVKSRNYLKKQVLEEIEEMEDLIEAYKGHVKFLEIKELEFKEHFEKILINEFQELYASYDASKLFTCAQYTNTQVFHGHEDPKDSITSLIRQLEREYIYLTSGLDDLNQEVVKAAKKEFFSQDLKMMKQAHLAQRQLKECDILSKALFNSFKGPRRRKYKM